MARAERPTSTEGDHYRHDFVADAVAHGADIIPIMFDGCNLQYANFGGADWSPTTVIGGEPTRLDLRGLILTTVDAAKSWWNYAILDDASIMGDSSFMHANMHGASARGLRARGIEFAGTLAAGIVLDGATLQACGLNFFHADGASAVGLTIEGGSMVSARWANADLTDATITGVNATGARFNRAHGSGVKLLNCDLADTRWRGADVRGWDFTGSSIVGADFTGALGLSLPQLQATKDWDLVKGTVRGIEPLLLEEARIAGAMGTTGTGASKSPAELWATMHGAREAGPLPRRFGRSF